MNHLTIYNHDKPLLIRDEYRLLYNVKRRQFIRSFFFLKQRKTRFFSIFRKRVFKNRRQHIKLYGFNKNYLIWIYKKKFLKRRRGVIQHWRCWKRRSLRIGRIWKRAGIYRIRAWIYRRHLFLKLKTKWGARLDNVFRRGRRRRGLAFLLIRTSKALQVLALQKKSDFCKVKASRQRKKLKFFITSQYTKIYNILKYIKKKKYILRKGYLTRKKRKHILRRRFTYKKRKHILRRRLTRKKRKHILRGRLTRKKIFKGYLFFVKKTTNNYFFTITNIFGEVLGFSSMGHAKVKTKKKRKSNDAFKALVRFFTKKIRKVKLKGKYCLVLKKRLKWFLRGFLIFKLKKINLKVEKLVFSKKKAHNGTKKPKRKRL